MAPSRRALLTGFLVAPPVALAQTAPRAPATAASATQDVLALRETIRAAVAKKDKAALEALYLENFMHLRDSGRADLKPERIALLLSGEETIETAPEENVAVHIYGAATAVATGASQIKDPATKRPAAFRWVVVYARGENGWQVALSQASRVPPPRR